MVQPTDENRQQNNQENQNNATAYNIFIQNTMRELRRYNSEDSNTRLMIRATAMWNRERPARNGYNSQ